MELDAMRGLWKEGFEALQGGIEQVAANMTAPTPVAASTPKRGREDDTQEDSSGWSHEATAGSSSDGGSSGARDGSNDPRRPPPNRTVQFTDQASPAPPELPVPGPRQTLHEKVNRSVHDLPHFAGKTGESLRDFLSRMALAARMGNWQPDYQCTQMHFQLRGTAIQYIESLPVEQVCTLEGLEAALRTRYEGKLVQKDAKEELRVLKRRASETPEDYGLRIKNLTRMAYPGDVAYQEEEGVSAFLRGLPDQKAAETLLATGKDTVQDCVQTLAETERHRSSVGRTQAPLRLRQLEEHEEPKAKQKTRGSPAPVAQALVTPERMEKMEQKVDAMRGDLTKVLTQMGQLNAQMSPPRRRMGQERRQPQPSQDRPCHICGSAKHWASSCPKKRQNWSGQNKGSGNDRGLDQRSEGQSGNKQ